MPTDHRLTVFDRGSNCRSSWAFIKIKFISVATFWYQFGIYQSATGGGRPRMDETGFGDGVEFACVAGIEVVDSLVQISPRISRTRDCRAPRIVSLGGVRVCP